jgi:two-component system LytT family response regulator
VASRISCLIVDDEPLARDAVRACIGADPDLEIVGEATDGAEALALIERHRPGLVFLDVQMPEIGGFEVLQVLEMKRVANPIIIFVTAHDQYALRAFEAQALDYLLKPIDEQRFRRAVTAAKLRIVTGRGWYTAEQLVRVLAEQGFLRRQAARIAVKSKGGIVFVRLDEVEWIEAQGNYLRLHLDSESHLLRETMNSFEVKLDPAHFIRIHRSTIVNVDHIRNIEPWFTGEYIVRMNSGKELTLTRSYRDNLRRLMGEDASLSAKM